MLRRGPSHCGHCRSREVRYQDSRPPAAFLNFQNISASSLRRRLQRQLAFASDKTLSVFCLAAERTLADAEQKRIMILMSDTGGGHRASAEALKAGFDLLYGDKYKVSPLPFQITVAP